MALAGCPRSDPSRVDAGPGPGDGEAGPPPGVSLLQTTPTRLALEWQFENGGEGPARSWDPFHGWAGKWLAVRIPRDAHVTAIRLKAEGSMRASVWRDGTKLAEATLNGETTLQIDRPGGDYRLEALGVPSRISDLDVIGQPGAERTSVARLPGVRFGSLEVGEDISGPWPALEAFCEKRGGDRCGHTAVGLTVTREAAPLLGAAVVGTTRSSGSGPDAVWLALRTLRGWFIVRDAKRVETGTLRFERPEAGLPLLRFEDIEHSDDTPGRRGGADQGRHVVDATRWLIVCRFVDDWPDCDERHALGRWTGEVEVEWPPPRGGPTPGPPAPFPPPSGRWNEPKTPRILPDGGVLLERGSELRPTR